jgi:hypothetical protein
VRADDSLARSYDLRARTFIFLADRSVGNPWERVAPAAPRHGFHQRCGVATKRCQKKRTKKKEQRTKRERIFRCERVSAAGAARPQGGAVIYSGLVQSPPQGSPGWRTSHQAAGVRSTAYVRTLLQKPPAFHVEPFHPRSTKPTMFTSLLMEQKSLTL